MSIFRLTAITLSLTLLAACGGGGGGGGAAAGGAGGGGGMPPPPPPPPPPALEELPNPLVTASTARTHITGNTVLNMSEAEIGNALVSRAAGTASPLLSNIANLSLDDARRDEVTCMERSCVAEITDGSTSAIDFDLDSFGNTPEFNSALTAFAREHEPVMMHRGVSLAQARAAGRAPDGTVFHYQSYGGWLQDSVFAVQTATGGIRGNEQGILLFSYSFGNRTGADPSVDATWEGVMIGRHIDTDAVVQGDAEIRYTTTNMNMLDHVLFSNAINLGDGSAIMFGKDDDMSELRFENIPLADSDGTFEVIDDQNLGSIKGAFYGAGHREVGGIFDSYNIIGAFGAVSQ